MLAVFVLFQNMKLHSAQHWKLLTFEFDDFELTDDETISASIRMFLDLDFLDAVHTKQEVYRRSLVLPPPFCYEEINSVKRKFAQSFC